MMAVWDYLSKLKDSEIYRCHIQTLVALLFCISFEQIILKKKKKIKVSLFFFVCCFPLLRLGELPAVIAIETSPNIKLEVLSQEVPQ